jgi:hypothetical protein
MAKIVVAEGPMYKSYKVDGDKVIVEFDDADGGLVVGDTEYNRKSKMKMLRVLQIPRLSRMEKIRSSFSGLRVKIVSGIPPNLRLMGQKVIVQI